MLSQLASLVAPTQFLLGHSFKSNSVAFLFFLCVSAPSQKKRFHKMSLKAHYTQEYKGIRSESMTKEKHGSGGILKTQTEATKVENKM